MCDKSILKDLYYGNINPSAKCFNLNSEYAKFVKIISDNEKILTAFLNKLSAVQEQHLFSQLMNAQNEISLFNELEQFTEGFRLGAKFILDTFVINQRSVMRDIC